MLRTINTIPQIIIHEDDYRVTEGGENLYRIESSVKGYDIGDNVYASMTVMIDTFIKIEDDVEIYPYVQIRDSCWICNNVKIYSFVHIGENVCIDDDVIIGPETWISDYSHIGNMSRIGADIYIGHGAKIGCNACIMEEDEILCIGLDATVWHRKDGAMMVSMPHYMDTIENFEKYVEKIDDNYKCKNRYKAIIHMAKTSMWRVY